MRYYAGLDVSLEETAICIVDEAGKIERELRAPSEPDALIETFSTLDLSLERIGLEACSLSSWLHQEMTPDFPQCVSKRGPPKQQWARCRIRRIAMTLAVWRRLSAPDGIEQCM